MQSHHSPARDSWRKNDQTYNHPYQHPTMAHYPHGVRTSRPEAPVPRPAQNSTHRERAMHMIDQSQNYGQYTSLKVPLDEVYETIKDRGLLYTPTPIARLPNMKDKGRFCKFHGTHGHITIECKDLKTQVEDSVRNRYLDEFVDGVIPIVGSSCEEEQNNRNMGHEQSMVRVIAKGPTLVGDSNRSRKNYTKYVMTGNEMFFNTPAAKRARSGRCRSCGRMRMKREFYIHMLMH